MQCGVGWCGHCQLGPLLLCRDGPVVGYDVARPLLEVEELCGDGQTACGRVEVRLLRRMPTHPARLRGRTADCWPSRCRSPPSPRRPVRSSAAPTMCRWSRGRSPHRPTSARIREIREQSGVLVAIGACATAGGIQALRNFADVAEFTSVVYARPDYIHTLATSTPASAHVTVDYELRGCPIDRVNCSTPWPRCWSAANPTACRHGVHRMQTVRCRPA